MTQTNVIILNVMMSLDICILYWVTDHLLTLSKGKNIELNIKHICIISNKSYIFLQNCNGVYKLYLL